jgi:hypothetical protein
MTGIGIVDVSYSGLDLCASGKGAYRITARSRGNLNLGAAWILGRPSGACSTCLLVLKSTAGGNKYESNEIPIIE